VEISSEGSFTVDDNLIAVVVRFTRYESAGPEQWVDLMSWHTDLAGADAEAARLNQVRRNEDVTYFVKILRNRPRRRPSQAEPPP